jgi:hypothetical protein
MQAKVADRLFVDDCTSKNNQRLLKTFKIKTKAINSQYNFISDSSLIKLCDRSRYSLEEVCIRNGTYLSNQTLSDSLVILQNLQKLDLSYCRQVTDDVVIRVATELSSLKNIGLRFLNLISGEAIKQIFDSCRNLEGIDFSGCFSVDLNCLIKLRGNNKLKCLLLEYLMVKSDHLRHLEDSTVSTISIFCKRSY